MLKTKAWDAQCELSPLPVVIEGRTAGSRDAALLKTEVSLATCPKISCELNLIHGFAYEAAL